MVCSSPISRRPSSIGTMLVIGAVSLAHVAFAQSVTGTLTGIIISGKDTYGYFGPKGRDLTYHSFSTSYSYDPGAGFQDVMCGTGCDDYQSSTQGAMTQSLTIDGVTFSVTSDASAYVWLENDSNDVLISADGSYPTYPDIGIQYTPAAYATLANPSTSIPGGFMLLTATVNTPKSINMDEFFAESSCGDDRDALITEYIKAKNKFVPNCSNFTGSASGPTYTFAMLNWSENLATGQPYSQILLNIVLVQAADVGDGLDLWLQYLKEDPNYVFHQVNSGYRNPARQHIVNPKTVESQHVYGDAVDLINISQTRDEYNTLSQTAYDAGADWIEPWSPTKTGKSPCWKVCVHADWRNHPMTFAP